MRKKLIVSGMVLIAVGGTVLYHFLTRGPAVDGEDVWSADNLCVSDICWKRLGYLPRKIGVFKTQVWHGAYYDAMHRMIIRRRPHKGKSVLCVGTGCHAVALLPLAHMVKKVVAMDAEPLAVANARYNIKLVGWQDTVKVRLIPRAASNLQATLKKGEKFDIILSIHHWHQPTGSKGQTPGGRAAMALSSMIKELSARLNAGGRMLFGYRRTTALTGVRELAKDRGLGMKIWLEDRQHRFLESNEPGHDGSYAGQLALLEIFFK